MTTARRKRKQYRPGVAAAAVLAAAYTGVASVLATALPAAPAAATERIVVDWHTGLAIGGYDPVAFFTDGKPIAGRADLELRHAGTIWRFANIGNRAAFAARPDVYMPQYGGYDPLGVARGVAVAGNPFMWLIADDRLYLFYSAIRRDAFAAKPMRAIDMANRKWPDVERALTP